MCSYFQHHIAQRITPKHITALINRFVLSQLSGGENPILDSENSATHPTGPTTEWTPREWVRVIAVTTTTYKHDYFP